MERLEKMESAHPPPKASFDLLQRNTDSQLPTLENPSLAERLSMLRPCLLQTYTAAHAQPQYATFYGPEILDPPRTTLKSEKSREKSGSTAIGKEKGDGKMKDTKGPSDPKRDRSLSKGPLQQSKNAKSERERVCCQLVTNTSQESVHHKDEIEVSETVVEQELKESVKKEVEEQSHSPLDVKMEDAAAHSVKELTPSPLKKPDQDLLKSPKASPSKSSQKSHDLSGTRNSVRVKIEKGDALASSPKTKSLMLSTDSVKTDQSRHNEEKRDIRSESSSLVNKAPETVVDMNDGSLKRKTPESTEKTSKAGNGHAPSTGLESLGESPPTSESPGSPKNKLSLKDYKKRRIEGQTQSASSIASVDTPPSIIPASAPKTTKAGASSVKWSDVGKQYKNMAQNRQGSESDSDAKRMCALYFMASTLSYLCNTPDVNDFLGFYNSIQNMMDVTLNRLSKQGLSELFGLLSQIDGLLATKAMDLMLRKIKHVKSKIDTLRKAQSEDPGVISEIQNQSVNLDLYKDQALSFGELQVKRFRDARHVCPDFHGMSLKRVFDE